MTVTTRTPDSADSDTADVLVIGGGPAATWAAISAAEAGGSVALVDKGYCGTSGATAAGGNNLWLIPPGPKREKAVRDHEAVAGGITDSEWMFRVLTTSWHRIEQLAAWGYPFPVGADGSPMRSSLQGPEYLRRMRRKPLLRIGAETAARAEQKFIHGFRAE